MKTIASRHEPNRWRRLLRVAILEPDLDKLGQQTHEAEDAIMQHIEEGLQAGRVAEQWELIKALYCLRDLRLMSEGKTAQRNAAENPIQGQTAA